MATFTAIPHLIMLLNFDCVTILLNPKPYLLQNLRHATINQMNLIYGLTRQITSITHSQGKNKRHLLHRYLGHLSTTNVSVVYNICLCAPHYSLSRWTQLFLHAPFFLLLFNILTKMPVASSSIHFL